MDILTLLAILGLFLAGLEDLWKRQIGYASLVLLGITALFTIVSDPMVLIRAAPIIVAIIVLHVANIIGGGDAKVFILSSICIDRGIVFLSVVSSLATILLVRRRNRRSMPLVTIFLFWILLWLATLPTWGA